MFLVDSADATARWDEVEAAIQTVMERGGAEVISLQKWDERRLAYDIAGRKRGMYILCYFRAEPSVISGIERDVRLNELLLRVLVLKAEHITEEDMNSPTPAQRKEIAERKAAEEAARRSAEETQRRTAEAAEGSGDEERTENTAVGIAEEDEDGDNDFSDVDITEIDLDEEESPQRKRAAEEADMDLPDTSFPNDDDQEKE